MRVEIQGPRELYIEEGSSLTLLCLVTSLIDAAKVVYWYHGNTLIDYNSPRGGVKLQVSSHNIVVYIDVMCKRRS